MARAVVHAVAGPARLLVAWLALGVAAVTAVVLPDSAFGHPGIWAPLRSLGIVAGTLMLLAGAVTWLDRLAMIRGGLAILVGLAFVAPAWEAWPGAPSIVRSVAAVTSPFFLPAAAHLVLSPASGRLAPRPVRVGVAAGYLVAAVAAVATALLRDPFLDPACVRDCRYNVLLLSSQPAVVRAMVVGLTIVSLVIGAGLVLVAARRMLPVTWLSVAARWPILVPGVILGAEAAVRAATKLAVPLLQPWDQWFGTLFIVRSAGLIGLAAGLVITLVRARTVRAAVARLRIDLGAAPEPGSLATALGRATGDPTVEVVYPVPEADRYVDAAGRTVPRPSAGNGRAVTPIVLRGRPVAFVVHDEAALDADQLRREIGAAARLAIENERLQAEVLAQLADLRASRIRIVEAGDAERRRLERNLHDGAQQRLLALGYDLRVAAASAVVDGDARVEGLLASAAKETGEAITALRDVAHGIYPAVLSESGIGPALWSLSDASAVPVEVADAPSERFGDAVERTAYEVVAEAVEAAKGPAPGALTVRVGREGDDLVVEVDGAGDAPFVHLSDRIGALGGRITIGGTHLRAEIPCASS